MKIVGAREEPCPDKIEQPHNPHSWFKEDFPTTREQKGSLEVKKGGGANQPTEVQLTYSKWCQPALPILHQNPSWPSDVHAHPEDRWINQVWAQNQAKQDDQLKRPGRNAPYEWLKLPQGCPSLSEPAHMSIHMCPFPLNKYLTASLLSIFM